MRKKYNAMKRLFNILTVCAALLAAGCKSSCPPPENPVPDGDSICLLGASFAYSANTWFEMGCEELGLNALNYADGSGINIADDAVRMHDSDFLSDGRLLDSFEILAILHTHNYDVCDTGQLADDYTSYEVSKSMGYARAFDYVIRKYADNCRALEFDESSKWFGVKGGKPVRILFCTHWHDARTIYNESVRRLCERWPE